MMLASLLVISFLGTPLFSKLHHLPFCCHCHRKPTSKFRERSDRTNPLHILKWERETSIWCPPWYWVPFSWPWHNWLDQNTNSQKKWKDELFNNFIFLGRNLFENLSSSDAGYTVQKWQPDLIHLPPCVNLLIYYIHLLLFKYQTQLNPDFQS